MKRLLFLIWMFFGMILCQNYLLAQRDFGDAPSGKIAYPGIEGRFPTFLNHTSSVIAPMHNKGSWVHAGATFYLGNIPPTSKINSDQNPNAPENDAAPCVFLQSTGSNPLASLVVNVNASPNHDDSQPLFLNVLIDQNRDGQWRDGYTVAQKLTDWNLEWQVRDLQFFLTPDLHTELAIDGIRLSRPDKKHWMRIIISDTPLNPLSKILPNSLPGSLTFWDGTMKTNHDIKGEIEDHFLQPADSLDSIGIFLPGRLSLGKPKCILSQFINIEPCIRSAHPFGFKTKFVAVPFMPPRQPLQYGFRYKESNINGGCTIAPEVEIHQYGPNRVSGIRQRPRFGTVNPTPNNILSNLPLVCPHPLQIMQPMEWVIDGHFWFRGDVIDHNDMIQQNPEKPWNVFYPGPLPQRRRIYSTRNYIRSCGCEIKSFSIMGSEENPTDYSTGYRSIKILDINQEITYGQVEPIFWAAGSIFENFTEVDSVGDFRPFPDPDFVDYKIIRNDPNSISGLNTDVKFTTPGSLLLAGEDTYVVRPNIYLDTLDNGMPINWRHVFEVEKVRLWLLGNIKDVVLIGGQEKIEDVFPNPFNGWTMIEYKLDTGFNLQQIRITGYEGFVDSIRIDFMPSTFVPTGDFEVIPNELFLNTGDSYSFHAFGEDITGFSSEVQPIYTARGGTMDNVSNVYTAGNDEGEFVIIAKFMNKKIEIPVHIFNNITVVTEKVYYDINFEITPNPAFEEAILSFNLNQPENLRIKIFDINGKLRYISSQNYYMSGDQQVYISLSNLPIGIYFVRLESENQSWIKKLVKI